VDLEANEIRTPVLQPVLRAIFGHGLCVQVFEHAKSLGDDIVMLTTIQNTVS